MRLAGTSVTDEGRCSRRRGRTITFPGFLRAYVEDIDESGREGRRREAAAAPGTRRRRWTRASSRRTGHTTSPPARYTEASLVKALEELGIGRPSTYASILQTIQDRGYVWKKGAALVPSWTAFAVIGLLESYFGRLVDYGFTASVENDLDAIANGATSRVDWLRRFYFGAERGSVRPAAHLGAGWPQAAHRRAAGRDRRPRGQLHPDRRRRVVVRVGRYGPYLQRGEERASHPRRPGARRADAGEGRGAAVGAVRRPGAWRRRRPAAEITAKNGRYGPYVTDGDRTASLFKSMSLDTVTLADAQRLLTLPRIARQCSTARRSPRRTAATARTCKQGQRLAIDSTPRTSCSPSRSTTRRRCSRSRRQRGRRAAAGRRCKELGDDPGLRQADGGQGRPVRSLRHRRRDQRVAARAATRSRRSTDERAVELLADRRARGPAKKAPRKAPAKKAAGKEESPRQKAAPAKAPAGKV